MTTLTGSHSEQPGLWDDDLRLSQVELVGPLIEFMGRQLSIMGLDTMVLTTQVILQAATGLATSVNRWGLCTTELAGGVIVPVTGWSAMLHWLSRHIQYSNMDL